MIAGAAHIALLDMSVYKVNPPLLDAVASLIPLAVIDPRIPSLRHRTERDEFDLGTKFMAMNKQNVLYYCWLARLVPIAICVFGTFLLFTSTLKILGKLAAVGSSVLWMFAPPILGYGSVLANDVPAGVFAFVAAISIAKFYSCSTWKQSLYTGLSCGLCLMMKLTCVVLVPCWVIIGVISVVRCNNHAGRVRTGVLWLLAATVAWIFVNTCYGWHRVGIALGDYQFDSQLLKGDANPVFSGNRFVGTSWARLPVPVSEHLLCGIDLQALDFQFGLGDSYFLGTWSPRGWVAYYLVGCLTKFSAGFVGLVIVAMLLSIPSIRRMSTSQRATSFILLLHGLALFVFVSLNTGFSQHFRYCLAAAPFLFFWTGGIVGNWVSRASITGPVRKR